MIPEPQNKHVLLYSDKIGKITRHHYVSTRACQSEGEDAGPAWEHLFACEISGAIRRFGMEDRKTPGNVAENN